MANSMCDKERTMKTQRELDSGSARTCVWELDSCPICKGEMKVACVSGPKLL